jgi:hypothetical protein
VASIVAVENGPGLSLTILHCDKFLYGANRAARLLARGASDGARQGEAASCPVQLYQPYRPTLNVPCGLRIVDITSLSELNALR